MKSRVNIQDIAREAGVSIATVSRCISGSGRVSESTRARIQEVIERYDHDQRNMSRVFRKGRVKTLGVIVQQLAHPYFVQTCSALEYACRQRGWVLLLGVATDNPATEEQAIKLFLDKDVDALVLVGGSTRFYQPGERFTAVIKAACEQCTVLFLNGYADIPGVVQVRVDEAAGFRGLLDRARSLGHHRFAYIGGDPQTGAAIARKSVFLSWMEEHKFSVVPEWVVDSGFSIIHGVQSMTGFLGWKEPPGVVICCNDVVAAGALKTMQERGFRVPRDMSIAGFDGIDFNDYPFPALSTVSQNYGACADAILDGAEGLGSPSGGGIVTVAPLQVEGQTLGPP